MGFADLTVVGLCCFGDLGLVVLDIWFALVSFVD